MVKTLLSTKKGLSGVITVVLMIALVMAAAAIVWGIVNGLLKDKMESSKSCFGNFNKVTINPIYTCYDSTNDLVQFSLKIGNIDVDEVLVSVSSSGNTKGYTLTNTDQQGIGLTRYPSGGEVILPGKDEGRTYTTAINSFPAKPDLIQIAPTLNGQQCGESDTISGIESCSLWD